MKNFNGVSLNNLIFRRDFQKRTYKGCLKKGIAQFTDLRGGLTKKRVVFLSSRFIP